MNGYPNGLTKRLIDLVLTCILFVVTLPVLLLGMCLIVVTNPGPVFFIQKRVGKDEKEFAILKLRTMKMNADKNGPVLTQKNDSRITPIGRWLRRTSIDELPQLINVLKGEMSLVGPRPEVPVLVKEYTEYQRKVFQFKPGITGYSQVNGRAALEIDTKLDMDIAYMESSTLCSDIRVILKTPIVILSNEGNVM